MRNLFKNIILAIVAFIILVSLFSSLGGFPDKTGRIPLSEVAAKIRAGEVASLLLEGDTVRIRLKDDSMLESQKEREASLTESFANLGLTEEQLAGVAIEVKSESSFGVIVLNLLPIVLPFLLILLFFWLIFRQARAGQMQAFTFGASGARMFDPKKEKVTFKDVAGAAEAKEELREVVEFLRSPGKFLAIGARIPRGVLLMGAPGTGKCVVGDTLVATNKGLVEIRDIPKYFWVNPDTSEVHGAHLSSFDIERTQSEELTASHWYDLGQQNTTRITLGQGISLEGTPEHPVLVMNDRGELEFKPLGKISAGDPVAVKFNTQSFGNLREVDTELAYIMGLLTGDGNLSHASRVGFTTKDTELAYAFKEYVGQKHPEATLGLASDGITHVVNSWSMKRDLYRAGMSYLLSYDKVIPPNILMAPREVVVAFLQGLFDTDGYFGRYSAGITTVSKKLSDQVLSLLLNLGIIASRRIKTSANPSHPRPVYEIVLSGTALEVFAQSVGFRLKRKQRPLEEYLATHAVGNTNIDLFYNLAGYVDECWQGIYRARKSNETLARIAGKVRQRKRISRRSLKILVTAYEQSGITSPSGEYLKSLLKANLFFSSVAKTEKGSGRVYDFTVPRTHSFVSNGIISHNTLLARAVAGEANVPFFFISGSEFVEMFVGVGASRVRDLFRTAKKNAPAIVFVDEIDAVGRHRGAGLGGGHDEREQTLNQILVEMDGFDRDTNVIVMAATNRPDILDPALLRPGRFDRRIVIDEPDIRDREAILQIHANDKKLEENVNLRLIAERTPGFSGADLANLINEAAIASARQNKKKIGQAELISSIEKVLLGPERKSRLLSKKEKEIAAYHEAGHALVASVLPNADPVHKVSIISRGRAGGYTLKLPSEEIHFYPKAKFDDELASMLAGHAAEKLVFNEITTGPTSDIKMASDLARRIVTEYGMSAKLGPVSYGEKDQLVFLGKEISERRNYSEEIAAAIDKEVSSIIGRAYKRATKILKEKRELLDKIAGVLIEKEVLEQAEFNQLIAGLKPQTA